MKIIIKMWNSTKNDEKLKIFDFQNFLSKMFRDAFLYVLGCFYVIFKVLSGPYEDTLELGESSRRKPGWRFTAGAQWLVELLQKAFQRARKVIPERFPASWISRFLWHLWAGAHIFSILRYYYIIFKNSRYFSWVYFIFNFRFSLNWTRLGISKNSWNHTHMALKFSFFYTSRIYVKISSEIVLSVRRMI